MHTAIIRSSTPNMWYTAGMILLSATRGDGSPVYPARCPQHGEPADWTQCCRHSNHTPVCCQQRATTVCARRIGSTEAYTDYGHDPGSLYEVSGYCPQPGDAASFTLCSDTGEVPCIHAAPGKPLRNSANIVYGLLLLLPGLCLVLIISTKKAVLSFLSERELLTSAACWQQEKLPTETTARLNNQVTSQITASIDTEQQTSGLPSGLGDNEDEYVRPNLPPGCHNGDDFPSTPSVGMYMRYPDRIEMNTHRPEYDTEPPNVIPNYIDSNMHTTSTCVSMLES